MSAPTDRRPAWAVLAARGRVPLIVLGVLVLLADGTIGGTGGWLGWAGAALMVVGFALYFRVGTVHAPSVELRAPVRGRWVAVNSPAGKVPSHGVHAYGQTYAVDLVHAPQGDWSLDLGWRGPLLLELTGRVLGNHVVLRIAPDTYVAVAHVRRGSVRVRTGETVRAGELLGECGNSGNTSEPHVHLQVMDRPWIAVAAGLPMRFTGAVDDAGHPVEMPRSEQALIAA